MPNSLDQDNAVNWDQNWQLKPRISSHSNNFANYIASINLLGEVEAYKICREILIQYSNGHRPYMRN